MSICLHILILLFKMNVSVYTCTPKTSQKDRDISLSIYLVGKLENSSLPGVTASPFLSDKHCLRGKV